MFPFYTIKRPHNIAVIVILLRKNSIVVIAFTEQLILSFFMLFDLGKMHRISILTVMRSITFHVLYVQSFVMKKPLIKMGAFLQMTFTDGLSYGYIV